MNDKVPSRTKIAGPVALIPQTEAQTVPSKQISFFCSLPDDSQTSKLVGAVSQQLSTFSSVAPHLAETVNDNM